MNKKFLLAIVACLGLLASCGGNSQPAATEVRAPETENPIVVTSIPVNEYTITWKVGENTSTEVYQQGKLPTFKGSTELPDDETYTYIFKGWEPKVVAAVADATYTAQYEKVQRNYHITWVVNGVSSTEVYHYGETPSYKGPTSKEAGVRSDYVFAGWDKPVAQVTEDTTYTAVYNAENKMIDITFVVDGLVTLEKFAYGTTPAYVGTPSKLADAQYTYSFNGWEPKIAKVSGPATYTAKFTPTLRQYDITFVYGDNVVETQKIAYGTMPEAPRATEKSDSAAFAHSFVGWDKEIQVVTGDAVYYAIYERSELSYPVKYYVNGTLAGTETVQFGHRPTGAGVVTDDEYYTFVGWDYGDVTYRGGLMPVVTGPVELYAHYVSVITVNAINANFGNLIDTLTYEWECDQPFEIDMPVIGTYAFPNREYVAGIADQNYEFDVYYNLLSVWDGSIAQTFSVGNGSSSNPICIYSAAEFALFAALVNAGVTFEGMYVLLNRSIVVNANFPVIGSATYPFKGYFDGQFNMVNGLAYNSKTTRTALFGELNGGILTSLTVNGNVTVGQYGGLLVGRSVGGIIDNCNSYGSIIQNGGNGAGGIAGGATSGSTIQYCQNYATVECTAASNNKTAGLVGCLENSGRNAIIYCDNFGDVNGYANVAGICGEAQNSSSINRILYVQNYGYIELHDKMSNVAGIVANSNNIYVQYAYNFGVIVNNAYTTKASENNSIAAGIAAAFAGANSQIAYAYNVGEVYGAMRTGGISGNTSGQVIYCYNLGYVSSGETDAVGSSNIGQWTGGIVAVGNTGLLVGGCYNYGMVFGTAVYVGGIVGCVATNADIDIQLCYNTPDAVVYGLGNGVGGILGGTLNAKSGSNRGASAHLVQCYNYGTVVGNDKVGGLVGAFTTVDSTIDSKSANYGQVGSTNPNAKYVGALVGAPFVG